MTRSFWNGRRVFVTGHTGFKGSWLCLWLQSAGATTCGYALEPPTTPNLFEAAGVANGMESQIADVRDLDSLVRAMRKFQPDVVLHLAALSVVRESYEQPVTTYATNVMGTVNVLECVRSLRCVRALVNVTSDKCYENREWVWPYRETDTLGGHDPYSNSKACAELVTSAYSRSFFHANMAGQGGVGIGTCRAGNVLGGGDWTRDQLVPDIMRAFSSGHPPNIRNPRATRPWQFVLEPLHGYLMLAEKLWSDPAGFSEAWNFGPTEEDTKTVGWIVEELCRRWGDGTSWKQDSGSHPHEAGLLKVDSSKSRSRLNWHPVMRLSEALDWVVEWYQTYLKGADVRSVALEQIQRFEERSTQHST
jgi:CDP-glucose 4,6-dehydratase